MPGREVVLDRQPGLLIEMADCHRNWSSIHLEIDCRVQQTGLGPRMVKELHRLDIVERSLRPSVEDVNSNEGRLCTGGIRVLVDAAIWNPSTMGGIRLHLMERIVAMKIL